MKFLAGVLTEVVNILMIIQSENVSDVVQNFISLGIISEIDNSVAESMFSLNLGEMEEHPILFPVTQLYVYDWKLWLNDLKKKNESCLVHAYNLIQICIVNILTFFYNVIFFYFIPFAIIAFV